MSHVRHTGHHPVTDLQQDEGVHRHYTPKSEQKNAPSHPQGQDTVGAPQKGSDPTGGDPSLTLPQEEGSGDTGGTRAVGVPATPVTRTVNVSSTQALKDAIQNAQPGDDIVLAPGHYDGPLTMSGKTGVTLSGTSQAIIHTDSTKKPAFTMDSCNGCTMTGLAISGGQKTRMVKNSNHNVFDSLDVSQSQMEGLHLKDNSSDNTIQNCSVHDTGLGGDTPAGNNRTQADDGEGIYIGTAKSNNASGDRSNNNAIIGNTIYNTTAENIDIKEFTSGGTIVGNKLDGGKCGDGATSVVEIKGSGYTVTGNTVRNANGKEPFRNYSVKGAQDSGTGNTIENNQVV